MSKIVHGTLKVKKRVITNIKKAHRGYIFYGKSFLDFGYIHKWEVGPYATIFQGLKAFNALS